MVCWDINDRDVLETSFIVINVSGQYENINKNCARKWNKRTSLHCMISNRNSHAIIVTLNFIGCPVYSRYS